MPTLNPRRLVVLAPNWLGDAVMALPLVADVRRAWPEAAIAVAARGSVAALFRMVAEVDEVISMTGSGGVAAMRAWRQNARTLAAGEFDTALLLPNSFLAAWTASRARIAERWGFRTEWRGRLLTCAVPPPRGRLHQAAYYQALGAGLGLSPGPPFARVSIPVGAHERARALLEAAGVSEAQRYVVMAPGAAYGRAKQWLPERFAELSVMLAAERGITTVLIGADADAHVCGLIRGLVMRKSVRVPDRASERSEASAPYPIGERSEQSVPDRANERSEASMPYPIGQRSEQRVVDLSGRTDLEMLAAVLAGADAVVANDSGAMHLAAAVGTRVVAVFGATDERRTAPLRAGESDPAPAVVSTDVWCRPCMLRECPIDHRCMTGVTARAVFEALALT